MSTTAGLLEGHYLITESPSRGGRITHRASCQCDKVFVWQTREEDHAQHILAVVWAYGFESGTSATEIRWDANPFLDNEDVL
jgi:hypothetical protein